MSTTILEFRNICKHFSGVTVLDNICFDVCQGEVHCIVGENGAGKSTLMKILSGIYHEDNGDILYCGQKESIASPFVAQHLGISTVHQELNVIENLSIEDNMTLGKEAHAFGFIQKKKNASAIKQYIDSVEVQAPLNTKMKNLSTGQKQMVAIAKALSMNAKILIFDEPTAALSEIEAKNLFMKIRELKNSGVTILYISHRMKEIFDIGDKVTVLKDGKYVCTKNIKDTNAVELAELMVGRELKRIFPERSKELGEVVLEVRNLSTDAIKNVSFKLRSGEVLGISGIVGSGRTEVLRAVFGADKILDGEIILYGKSIKRNDPSNSITKKVALIPEDRRKQGIIKVASVKDNMALLYYRFHNSFSFLQKKGADQMVEKYVKDLRIKLANTSQKIQYLSGGNQQKVVLAKWLCIDSQVLLLDEPTQGIDVGAKEDIYQLINDLAKKGKAIIVVSSEIIELLNLCNNILVMRNGQVVGELSSEEANEEVIIKTAMGVLNNAKN